MEEKKGGRAVKEKNEGGELRLWPNVLFHPRILWGPLRPHMVAHECTSACAKTHTHPHTDSCSWWWAFGVVISLALSLLCSIVLVPSRPFLSMCTSTHKMLMLPRLCTHTHESIQMATFYASRIVLEPRVRCFTVGWRAKRKEWNQEPIFFFTLSDSLI